jgi:hypothetical protein
LYFILILLLSRLGLIYIFARRVLYIQCSLLMLTWRDWWNHISAYNGNFLYEMDAGDVFESGAVVPRQE